MGTLEKRSSVSRISMGFRPHATTERSMRVSRQKKRLNYFNKISLRIPTIFVRDFSRIGAVRNYDEVDVRFFLYFLRFGGGGGFCARDPYFLTHPTQRPTSPTSTDYDGRQMAGHQQTAPPQQRQSKDDTSHPHQPGARPDPPRPDPASSDHHRPVKAKVRSPLRNRIREPELKQT
jgi:hypothetical protein